MSRPHEDGNYTIDEQLPGARDNEPEIMVNGVKLSSAQSMAVRVAATSFADNMGVEDALGSDDVGRALAKGYRDRLSEVIAIMLGQCST